MSSLTRLRYTRLNGFLESNQILFDRKIVVVQIDIERKIGVIRTKKEIIETFEHRNIAVLKQKIKSYLKKYGANFYDEVRGKKLWTGN